jgi:hypothetical protein
LTRVFTHLNQIILCQLAHVLFSCFFVSTALSISYARAEEPVVQIGVGGTWKLGFPTRVTIQHTDKGILEFHTVDGDGVAVRYIAGQGKPIDQAGGPVEILIQNGRLNQQMGITVRDSDGTALSNYSIPVDARGTAIPATQTWIVGIGSTNGLEKLSSTIYGSTLSTFTTSVVTKVTDLPVHYQAYSGVDLMTISTSDIELLRQANPEQAKAIRDWIFNGGRAIIAIGKNADAAKDIAWLTELLPGTIVAREENVAAGPIESWIGSSKRLGALTCARMEPNKSIVSIQLLSPTREPIPFISRRVLGLGQVVFVATDLDQGPLPNWEDQPAFLRRLLPAQWEQWTTITEGSTTSSEYLGFEDLSGQLRATLDVFPQVQNTGLTFMAVILALFLAMIGPLDYFFTVRFLKRPSATWWTLVLSSIAACFVIAVIARSWKPQMAAVNDCVVWDLDFDTKHMTGRSWLHVYSGSQDKYNVRVEPLTFWSSTAKPIPAKVDWMGLPGQGLGGFDSSVTADRGMPAYTISLADDQNVEVQGVGIPLAGTKAFQANWTVDADIDTSATKLGLVSGSDLLQGEWVNPLPVDIHNAVILFRNGQYSLPTRIRPGQKIPFSISVIPKDFARQLQRRRIVDGIEKGSPWQALERNDLSRLIEMMLFHRAAGGTGYTVLSHRYLQQLDLSELLLQNRAMVFGRIVEPTTKVLTHVGDKPIELKEGNRQNWIRMVIPVDTTLKPITP